MSTQKDIRWIQRFENYEKAIARLNEAIELSRKRELSDLEKQGLIQSFEYTFELAWKTLKDFLTFMHVEVKFPRDTIKKAFQYDLIDDGEIWLDMLKKRNLMAHTYEEKQMLTAYRLIINQYFQELKKMYRLLKEKKDEKQ